MYLHDLMINWKKVDLAVEEGKDSPISTLIAAVSNYTKYLATPKFKYASSRKCGFKEDHDVFKVHYLYDIIEKILHEAGIREEKKGLYIKNIAFHTGFSLDNGTFKAQTSHPDIELYSSDKYFHVGLEFEIQYRMASEKHFKRIKNYIPLIVFYVEKYYTEKDFEDIKVLKKDMLSLNPHAMLICITESVDKRLLSRYSEHEEYLYVARCNFKGDPYKDLQPQVFLSLYNKLLNHVNRELYTFDKITPFGHSCLVE